MAIIKYLVSADSETGEIVKVEQLGPNGELIEVTARFSGLPGTKAPESEPEIPPPVGETAEPTAIQPPGQVPPPIPPGHVPVEKPRMWPEVPGGNFTDDDSDKL